MKLYNNLIIPNIGLGTYLLEGQEAYDSVLHGLNVGYRLIDTAAVYNNEEEIGKAISDSRVPRDNLVIITKLHAKNIGYQKAIDGCKDSLKKLNLTYIDVFLIHWMPRSYAELLDTWRGFELLYSQGYCKAIGICNLTIYYLDRLIKDAKIKPMICQVECHPFLQQDILIDYCLSNNIVVMGYGMFAKGLVFKNQELRDLARHNQTTIANLLLSWGLKRNIITIPKSVQKERIESNLLNNFSMDDELYAKIKLLNDGLRVYRDPENNPFVE